MPNNKILSIFVCEISGDKLRSFSFQVFTKANQGPVCRYKKKSPHRSPRERYILGLFHTTGKLAGDDSRRMIRGYRRVNTYVILYCFPLLHLQQERVTIFSAINLLCLGSYQVPMTEKSAVKLIF